MIEQIKKHESVASISKPMNGKIFINLVGQQRHMRGDSSTKIWMEESTEKLFWKMGKGTCSSQFNADLDALKEYFEITRKY
jgi:hypothetical protein